jgi:hypothetical protein
LSEEEAMLDARLASLAGGKEGHQASEPFLSTAEDVLGLQGIRQGLKLPGVATPEKSIGARLEAQASRAQALRQPVMLIEIDAGGEGKIRADTNEHAAPGAVVDIEVVLVHPAPAIFQMPLRGG